MMYVKYPLSLRNVEDLLCERGIDISHETVRFWWNRFGPIFAAEIGKKRVAHLRGYPQWRWHLDEVFVKVNGKLFPLTCFVLITFFVWAAWVSFVQHEETGDTSAKIWAAMVILAFVADVLQ